MPWPDAQLVVLNSRPGELPTWARAPFSAGSGSATRRAASDALLRELVGAEPALAEVCAFVIERAEGNPFFAEELVHSLVEQGVLARERDGALRRVGSLDDARLPPTVQALLAARIDALPGDAKHVLQIAAVIGKRFGEAPLRAALEGEIDLASAFAALERAELVRREPAGDFSFAHPLTQEVAYAIQLQDARVRRHRRGAALQALHADRLGQHAAEIARHFGRRRQAYETREWRRRAALHVTHIQLKRPAPHSR
jgi:predicted ATPase